MRGPDRLSRSTRNSFLLGFLMLSLTLFVLQVCNRSCTICTGPFPRLFEFRNSRRANSRNTRARKRKKRLSKKPSTPLMAQRNALTAICWITDGTVSRSFLATRTATPGALNFETLLISKLLKQVIHLSPKYLMHHTFTRILLLPESFETVRVIYLPKADFISQIS